MDRKGWALYYIHGLVGAGSKEGEQDKTTSHKTSQALASWEEQEQDGGSKGGCAFPTQTVHATTSRQVDKVADRRSQDEARLQKLGQENVICWTLRPWSYALRTRAEHGVAGEDASCESLTRTSQDI